MVRVRKIRFQPTKIRFHLIFYFNFTLPPNLIIHKLTPYRFVYAFFFDRKPRPNSLCFSCVLGLPLPPPRRPGLLSPPRPPSFSASATRIHPYGALSVGEARETSLTICDGDGQRAERTVVGESALKTLWGDPSSHEHEGRAARRPAPAGFVRLRPARPPFTRPATLGTGEAVSGELGIIVVVEQPEVEKLLQQLPTEGCQREEHRVPHLSPDGRKEIDWRGRRRASCACDAACERN
jgi:hypothetical protein